MGGFFGTPVSYKDAKICQDCECRKQHQAAQDPAVVAEQQRRSELESKADELASQILISTTDCIFGKNITEHIGVARGGTVRAKNAISDIGAGLKNIVGGEVKSYTELLADAREQALHRMKVDAVILGADAVVGVNFSTSMIDIGAAEIAAFGTAVKLSSSGHNE